MRMSHSVWSAWIETKNQKEIPDFLGRRTPYGVRGLKRVTSCTS